MRICRGWFAGCFRGESEREREVADFLNEDTFGQVVWAGEGGSEQRPSLSFKCPGEVI
jgi:hypothetical protein